MCRVCGTQGPSPIGSGTITDKVFVFDTVSDMPNKVSIIIMIA